MVGKIALSARMFLKKKESYKIKHQRIKKYGGYSKVRTAIREEPIKMAQYLRGEILVVSGVIYHIAIPLLTPARDLTPSLEEQVTASVKIESATFIQTGIDYDPYSKTSFPMGYLEFSGTATLPIHPDPDLIIPLELFVQRFDIYGGISSTTWATIESGPWTVRDSSGSFYRIPGQPATGKWRATFGIFNGRSDIFTSGDRWKIMAEVPYQGKFLARDEAWVTIP